MKVRRQQKIKRTAKPQGPEGTPVKAEPNPKLGDKLIPAERYISPEFAKLEWEMMWSKVWMLGCLESDIPEPGDHIVTEIGKESILIVRQKDKSVRAFHNVCMHRGNKLVHAVHQPQEAANEFRCGYHDWRYGLDGRFTDIPDLETFPQGAPPCGGLIEIPCDVWGSFVWYSLNPEVEPLRDYLGIIPQHLDPYHFDRMVLTDWKTVEWDCNWKASVDAFNESYHVQGIHPQLLYYLDDLDIQIDCYEKHNRYLIAFGVLSPRVVSPSEIPPPIKVVMRGAGMDPASYEGSVYDIREAVQAHKRKHGEQQGRDYSALNDDQLTDDYHYTIFPNVTMNVHADDLMMFRQRPHPEDPNKMYFDYFMFELPDNEFDHEEYRRPKHRLYKHGETSLGLVVNQDAYNLPFVQAGMNSSAYPGLWIGNQELRIRHFHKTLDDYLYGSNSAARSDK
ncbi:aromatic ring-hydroxylating oxygenase subunit alpha [Hyphococcus sp.]|uniref:aromatic ring-hydroxylating oxygenase subunit alpha n=1 Tax=Hyphococcus sp. TaxID=2038636 RepID=UPI003CCB9D4A